MSTAPHHLPVIVLTGFLGSGKTTLLNKALREPQFADTAVIVNELGDIGLDHLLVTSATDNVVLLDSGCLCCGMLNSFKETLADLYHRRTRREVPTFRRVVVETTGLADPTTILQVLLRDSFVSHYFRLAGVVTTVDALFGLAQLDQHHECVNQVALADRLVLTKTDQTNHECPEPLLQRLRQINAEAPLQLAEHIDVGALLAESDDVLAAAAPLFIPTTAPHSKNVRADSFVIGDRIGWAGLAGWTELVRESFGARLLRCKGLLYIAEIDAPVLVQGVQTVFAPPQRLPGWPSADHRSRLVCITRDVDAELLRLSLRALQAEPGTYRAASLAELARTAAKPPAH